MNPIHAISEGVRALGGVKRMWAVYWLWTLVYALVVILPVTALLFHDLGHSLYSARMFDNFDVEWLLEIFRQTGGWPVWVILPLALVVGMLYLVAGTYLAGGALWVLRDARPHFLPAVFYQGCGRNFGRLFRLLLVSLVCYSIVFALGGLLGVPAGKIWGKGLEEHPIVIYNWFRSAVVLLLLLLVNMIFDYAKIHTVAEDQRNPFRAALSSAKLVFANFGRTSGAYAMVAAAGIALTLLYLAVSGWLPRRNWFWIALVLLLQQAYIVSRIWVRLLFFSAQTRVYESLLPIAAGLPPLSPEPAPRPASGPVDPPGYTE